MCIANQFHLCISTTKKHISSPKLRCTFHHGVSACTAGAGAPAASTTSHGRWISGTALAALVSRRGPAAALYGDHQPCSKEKEIPGGTTANSATSLYHWGMVGFFSPGFFERRGCKDGVQSIGSWRDIYGWGVAAWWWLSYEQLFVVPWQLFKNLSGYQHFFRTIVALLFVLHSPEFDVRVLIALLCSWCLTFLMYVNMDTIVTIVTSTILNASQKVYLWFYHSWSDMSINQILKSWLVFIMHWIVDFLCF